MYNELAVYLQRTYSALIMCSYAPAVTASRSVAQHRVKHGARKVHKCNSCKQDAYATRKRDVSVQSFKGAFLTY